MTQENLFLSIWFSLTLFKTHFSVEYGRITGGGGGGRGGVEVASSFALGVFWVEEVEVEVEVEGVSLSWAAFVGWVASGIRERRHMRGAVTGSCWTDKNTAGHETQSQARARCSHRWPSIDRDERWASSQSTKPPTSATCDKPRPNVVSLIVSFCWGLGFRDWAPRRDTNKRYTDENGKIKKAYFYRCAQPIILQYLLTILHKYLTTKSTKINKNRASMNVWKKLIPPEEFASVITFFESIISQVILNILIKFRT